ncbi:AAA family ATPase [Treponema putidum]|uniref:Endonuclease GajA/Old nuclease/RecF-like AAA domain-containing protein n=1 Tax=Treponema putidum TaxID=221027 RepID=A0ABY5HSD5_9SPIR|nr:AAA family ATPase [Treponema putidum]UTY28294.1 hypothetical protein E4N76_04360 [Treponema putidum]
MHRNKIRIKNFGPIKEGYTENKDGFFSVNNLTVFIGDQGSGKSTVAKLISTFLWIEKAFMRGDYNPSTFTTKEFIDLCKNQQLQEYFTERSELEFKGKAFSFMYTHSSNTFKIKKGKTEAYIRPKIMYIPSERNLISVIENAEKVQKLPPMLQEMIEELASAKKNYLQNEFKLLLPYYNVVFDKSSMKIFIKEKKYNSIVPLSHASSGLQSLVPLSIITNYLSDNNTKNLLLKLKDLSKYEKDNILEIIKNKIKDVPAIEDIVKSFFTSGIPNEVLSLKIVELTETLQPYINSCFINIVEEPEQNLFPASQVVILNDLIMNLNKASNNLLIITTHSPYILSAINNYLYADKLKSKGKRINLISENLLLNYNSVAAYKLENGCIKDITDDDLHMIDTTAIDDCSSEINNIYDHLYSLECVDET